MLESDSYKIFSFPQLADYERVLISLNIVIRDSFYLVKYLTILLTVFYDFAILEESLVFLIKSQNSTR
jgi:hypothetical protein